MAKMLKVIFSGVCTFTPGIPENPTDTLSDFFALMPAARSPRLARQKDGNDKARIVARHQAYLYVPDQNLDDVPEPAMLLRDKTLGLCNVYLVDYARISFDRTPLNPLRYFADPNRPVKGRPDDDDATLAPRNDSRWVPDSTELFPNGATLSADVDPRHDITNGKVTMVVHLKGGLIEANHPCSTAQPRTFQPAQVQIEARSLAPELTVTMEFPDDTPSIKLLVETLDPGEEVSGLPVSEMELFWRNTDMMQLRIGNDTLDEIVAMRGESRCAPVFDLPTAEAEFDLHYDLLDIQPAPVPPLPTRGGGHGDVGGCVGLKVKLPGSGGN
jgi:hypothetical protein